MLVRTNIIVETVVLSAMLVGFLYALYRLSQSHEVLYQSYDGSQTITVIDDYRNHQRCLLFTGKGASAKKETCVNLKYPQKLAFPYYKMMLLPTLWQTQPEHILVIGLGGGVLSETYSYLYPKAIVDSVEINPEIINIATKYFKFQTSSHKKIYQQDAVSFVKQALQTASKKYDIILLDAFDASYIPASLRTEEFLKDVKRLLKPQGVLAANVFHNSIFYQEQRKLFTTVFKNHAISRHTKSENRILLGFESSNLLSGTYKSKPDENLLKSFDIKDSHISLEFYTGEIMSPFI